MSGSFSSGSPNRPLPGTRAEWEAAIRHLNNQDARHRYYPFIRESFPVLDRSTQFVPAWFYPVVCEHAEAIVHGAAGKPGGIRRLVVVIPPGTYKSGIWSKCLPAWAWLHYPWMRFIHATNVASLSDENALRTRDLVWSEWYQKTFAPQWQLREDQSEKSYFETTELGARRAASTGSKVTGKKAHVIVVDDLHDANTVGSQTVRDADKKWFYDALWDRQINPKTSSIAVIGHRSHIQDIQSELIAQGWGLLHVPERWDEKYRKTYPVRCDPQTDPRQPGEYARPSMFAEEQEDEVRRESVAKGSADSFETKHQGDPKEAAGLWFPRTCVRLIPDIPIGSVLIRSWDTAATVQKRSSFTAGVLIGKQPNGRGIVADARRGKLMPDERDRWIENTCEEDKLIPGVYVRTVIEHPGGSGGVQVGQLFLKRLSRFVVDIVTTSGQGSKDDRAGPFASQWRNGMIDVVQGPWTPLFLDWMEASHGSGRDVMDSCSQGWNQIEGGPDRPDDFASPDDRPPEPPDRDMREDPNAFLTIEDAARIDTRY